MISEAILFTSLRSSFTVFTFAGRPFGIARNGGDGVIAREKLGENANAGFSGGAVEHYVHLSLLVEDAAADVSPRFDVAKGESLRENQRRSGEKRRSG